MVIVWFRTDSCKLFVLLFFILFVFGHFFDYKEKKAKNM
jgi:hypothetical protein